MKKVGNLFFYKDATFSKVAVYFLAFLFISSKGASPFLHTHDVHRTHNSVSITSIHCNACDYEAVQAVEPGSAIILPPLFATPEEKNYELITPLFSKVQSTSESRGPPQQS